LRARRVARGCTKSERLLSVAVPARELEFGSRHHLQGLGRLQDEGWIVTLPRYCTFRSRRTGKD
jgi:hypothetical protein